MAEIGGTRHDTGEAQGRSLPLRETWQWLAILACLIMAVLMILNNQMGGEGMWFWYATVFHNGAKLYSNLHTALQPFFLLETDAWMKLAGHKLYMTQLPSLVHAFLLAFGTLLILRESEWPDWQKAAVLFGVFMLTVCGHSYRFDDYHTVAESLITFALWMLLVLARTHTADGSIDEKADRRQLIYTAVLGLLCGCVFVTRLTDGAALICAAGICLPFLLRRRRVLCLPVFGLAVVLAVVITVELTGDTLNAWLSSSIFRAAASKGGEKHIFAAPLHMIVNTLPMLWRQKRMIGGYVVLAMAGWAVARFRPRWTRWIFGIQLALALFLFVVSGPYRRGDLIYDLQFNTTLVLCLTLLMYGALAWAFWRFLRSVGVGGPKQPWDARELLILVPVAEWMSYSAGAAAEPLTNYYAPVALILLLIPVIDPFRRRGSWASPTVAAIALLVGVSGVVGKCTIPYSWQNYKYAPMFVNREWYHHPVYGPMYIDTGLLHFSEDVCQDIGSVPGTNHPDLLSLPYPYPNLFCDTLPWHNYVQTFFDTSTRATIEHLIEELKTAPPAYIVYQRQLNIMVGAERLYNHNQPLAHRDLDRLIFDKLKSGEWTLIEYSDYLRPRDRDEATGTGWYVIGTQPLGHAPEQPIPDIIPRHHPWDPKTFPPTYRRPPLPPVTDQHEWLTQPTR